VLAHSKRAAASIFSFVFVETEKSVVSESLFTLDHAGETARGTFSLANVLMHIFGGGFATSTKAQNESLL
jgi:hypothetical protein